MKSGGINKIKRLCAAVATPAFILIIAALMALPAQAAGKRKKVAQPAVTSSGRRILLLNPVQNVRIQLPDDQVRDFGADFEGSLSHYLASHPGFILARPDDLKKAALSSGKRVLNVKGEYEWEGPIYPAAAITIHVDAFNFVTGSRGGRMFYGFDERFRTDFNNGGDTVANEFPLMIPFNYPNWFDHFFDKKGAWPTDSTSGLDLGDGFNVDVLFAFMAVKYATYRSALNVRIEMESPATGRHEFRTVQVRGKGFFYDVAGGYAAWQGGIGVARRTAMFDAFNRAIDAAVHTIDSAASGLPLTAAVDVVRDDGLIFLGTGRDAHVPAGTLYEAIDVPGLVLKVEQSFAAGSAARVAAGSAADLALGMRLRQIMSLSDVLPGAGPARSLASLSRSGSRAGALQSEPVQVANESIDLGNVNYSEPNLNGLAPKISRWRAFLKSLVETVFLPYRIWRYYEYDLAYLKRATLETADTASSPDPSIRSTEDWSAEAQNEAWAKQMRLSAAASRGSGVTIAVIDTGVDYNHPAIHDRLWLNPAPIVDSNGQQDRYGWDFISGDSRPYDDHYHGTQMASAVLAVAPQSRIMPLKVFNPWGVTNSASVLSAFTYAVDHGAQVILCGWATRRYSKAIETGIAYARDHGVKVVAAAGDLGLDLAKVPAYPASLASKYENVIVATALDGGGKRWSGSNFFSSPEVAERVVAIPAVGVRVAEPRNNYSRVSSTGIAAALYAGALAAQIQ